MTKILNYSLGGLLLLLALTFSGPPSIEGANILGVFTSHSPSHFIVHMSIMQTLAEQGHNITVVSSLQPKITHKSIKHIVIPLSAEDEKLLNDGMSAMAKQKPSFVTTMKTMLTSLSLLLTKQVDVLEHPKFKELYLNKDNKFDLVFNGFFFNLYQVGLGARFNAPLIVSWSGPPAAMVNGIVGNPELPASVPNMNVAVQPGQIMDFKLRFTNYMSGLSFGALTLYLESQFSGYYKRVFGDDPTLPSYEEAKRNVSLIFCNSHGISEGPIRPNVPGVVEIGGIQVKDKPNPLPTDIKEFLDKSKHGAILFSLGSNLKGDHINADVIGKIFKALSKLKQHVVWKWDDLKNLPGTSPNILYKKWLPQDDILAHPKIKLFITHAGKGGVSEAQYHGVPMLALPVFADQPGNADKLVDSGYGLKLDLLTIEEDTLTAGIKEILTNPSYAAKLERFSKLYRDRPMTARESVIYWTEYVLRHHGAPHIQSPLVHMGYIASNNLDIYALLVVVLVIVIFINKIVWTYLWRKCCGKSKKVTQKKVKKQ